MAKTCRSLALKLRTSYKGVTKMVNSTLKSQNGQVFCDWKRKKTGIFEVPPIVRQPLPFLDIDGGRQTTGLTSKQESPCSTHSARIN